MYANKDLKYLQFMTISGIKMSEKKLNVSIG